MNKMDLPSPARFPDYELIDCGNFEKLERFGEYTTIRPEPQAVWDKGLSPAEWEKLAHVRFVPNSSYAGKWEKLKAMPDSWVISYPLINGPTLYFKLALASFKHVGLFPEQAPHWNYIFEKIKTFKSGNTPRFLNLFAYTGAASLAAKAGGADVVHLDAVRQVVTWSKENMELSGLSGIRWIIEDAMKFVKREIKRGTRYQGIILDPPAYGHGPAKEQWKLEENINEMVKNVIKLLDPQKHFLILNTYSLGFSSLIIENLLKSSLMSRTGQSAQMPKEGGVEAPGQPKGNLQSGELFLPARNGCKLPLGVFGILSNEL